MISCFERMFASKTQPTMNIKLQVKCDFSLPFLETKMQYNTGLRNTTENEKKQNYLKCLA